VMVDAGTGSGAIALSLATELARSNPEGRVWAVDRSPDALVVARSNLERVCRHHDGPMLPVTMVQGSWLSALPAAMEGTITLVVSNPPYIEPTQWTGLQAEVRHEPAAALLAADGSDGTPGLGDVEAVLSHAWGWLSRPGAAVIEVAPDQVPAAVRMAQSIGYLDVHAVADLAGRSRALVGRVR
jgi:release factor glutamine methyltransferase